jgi:alpha-tubulin suppressor-like RCC1 family protein
MNVESMTIGLKYNGSLWAWGELNNHGQLGVGSLNTTAKTPQQIGTNFTSFEILEGGNKYIAKKTDGTLWAWGRDMGKLAGTMTEDLTTPTKIISEFNAINIDNTITLGTKNDGSLWGWSTNSYGQLGDGTTNPSSTTPKLIGTKYTTASSCGKSMFAIKSDNTLWGWGDNTSGQMGDGTTTARLSQKIVGMGYISVTASGCDGNATIFARKTDGTLWGWGSNEWGQLGDGTTTNSLTPKQITLP